MAEVVQIENLDAYIAEAILKVNNGVAAARKNGVLAELPEKLDFDVVVIASGGWQALDAVVKDDAVTTQRAGSGEVTVTKEEGETVSLEEGDSTDTESGATTQRESGTNKRVSDTFEQHTSNGDKVTETEE